MNKGPTDQVKNVTQRASETFSDGPFFVDLLLLMSEYNGRERGMVMSKRDKQIWKRNIITMVIMFYGFPLLALLGN